MVKKLGLSLAVLLVLTPLVVLGVGKVRLDRAMVWQEQRALSEAEVDQIIEEIARLDAALPLWDIQGGCDAGDALNPGIYLDGPESAPMGPMPWWDEEYIKGDAWLLDPESVPTGDYAIFDQIRPCGHWDHQSSGAYAEYVADPAPVGVELARVPGLVSLQHLAKMRLAAGLRGDVEMLVALQDVRHLAQLSKDGEGRLATLIAVALLRFERVAYERAVELGRIEPQDWEPVSQQDIELSWRAFPGLAAIFAGEAPLGSIAKVQAQSPRFSYCSALVTGLTYGLREQRVYGMDSPWPGELDRRELYAQQRQALMDSSCRLTVLRQTLEHPDWHSGPSEFQDIAPALLQLPYWRQWAILRPNQSWLTGSLVEDWREAD